MRTLCMIILLLAFSAFGCEKKGQSVDESSLLAPDRASAGLADWSADEPDYGGGSADIGLESERVVEPAAALPLSPSPDLEPTEEEPLRVVEPSADDDEAQPELDDADVQEPSEPEDRAEPEEEPSEPEYAPEDYGSPSEQEGEAEDEPENEPHEDPQYDNEEYEE